MGQGDLPARWWELLFRSATTEMARKGKIDSRVVVPGRNQGPSPLSAVFITQS
jgi:hypothetical protein